MSTQNKPMSDAQSTPDLVCNLNVLTAEQRSEHFARQQTLFTQMVAYHELPTGYQFDFTAEAFPLVAEFVALEQLCCPFFHITIEVLPASQYISLILAGNPLIKQFLERNLGEILKNTMVK